MEKCKVIHFGRKNEKENYYLNWAKLQNVRVQKDLGSEYMRNKMSVAGTEWN